MTFKHTNRPGFLLGFIDFLTAGLFFLLYMPLGGLQDEIEFILGHKVMPYWKAYLLGIPSFFIYTLVWMAQIAEELKGKAAELGIEGPYTSWWHMFGWNVFGLLLMGPAVATHRFFGTLNAVEKELNKRSGSAPEHDLSEDFAFFNYNELRLLLDCKYGLKPEHGIEDFETFLNINTDLGPNLASTDPRRASLSLARLVLMYFDDLHSGYIRGSGLYEIDPQAELLYQRACLGPSIRKMKSTKETYQNARKEVYRAWVPGYEEVDDTAFYYF